jgi:putrescine transport system permease protein
VKPEINAVASLILLSVSLMTFIIWFFAHRSEEKRKKALQQAMDESTGAHLQNGPDSRRDPSQIHAPA